MLGLSDVGVELDPWACATAVAAGHATVRADVTQFPCAHLAGRVDGLIASPPCQSFSAAGKGDGRAIVDQLVAAVHAGRWDPIDDGGASHVLEVGRWAETVRPRWVACEQVPEVLPVWRAYAARWRAMGWSTWAGVLCAADYGVPQTRRRALLLACLDRPAVPPAPTHCRGGADTLGGAVAPWVSMADALGWPADGLAPYERDVARPAPTLTAKSGGQWTLRPGGGRGRGQGHRDAVPDSEPAPTVSFGHDAASWIFERPATTVCGDPRLSFPGHHDEEHRSLSAEDGSVRLTLDQALALQSFPVDYPVQGNKTEAFRQVGNAVPPLLAAHVIAALTGANVPDGG